jgi:hypothetical protein
VLIEQEQQRSGEVTPPSSSPHVAGLDAATVDTLTALAIRLAKDLPRASADQIAEAVMGPFLASDPSLELGFRVFVAEQAARVALELTLGFDDEP